MGGSERTLENNTYETVDDRYLPKLHSNEPNSTCASSTMDTHTHAQKTNVKNTIYKDEFFSNTNFQHSFLVDHFVTIISAFCLGVCFVFVPFAVSLSPCLLQTNTHQTRRRRRMKMMPYPLTKNGHKKGYNLLF